MELIEYIYSNKWYNDNNDQGSSHETTSELLMSSNKPETQQQVQYIMDQSVDLNALAAYIACINFSN